jgi:FkbM family methyltransferase
MTYRIEENNDLDSCFKNCNPESNGERNFANSLDKNLVIFDVGCGKETEFLSYEGEVHYFDTVQKFVDQIRESPRNLNTSSHFNSFGLSSFEGIVDYYVDFQSLYNRTESTRRNGEKNKIQLSVRRASDYVLEKKINRIHLLKMDIEGHEFEALVGFGSFLRSVDFIQFEYGGCNIDSKVTLRSLLGLLEAHGFGNFSYLNPKGFVRIRDMKDHYNYCNIIAENLSK